MGGQLSGGRECSARRVDPTKELTVSFHSQVMWGQFLGLGYEGQGKYLSEMGKVVAERVYTAMGL
eukprot:SAG11_NODE_14602_length_606_cov_1.007890_1_plen_65_part_00